MNEVQWLRPSQCHSANCCVEVTFLASGEVKVRDSKSPGQVLTFTLEEWEAFIVDAKAGVYDFGG